MKLNLIAGFIFLLFSVACSKEQTQTDTTAKAEEVNTQTAALNNLSSPEAKSLLDENKTVVILDVRTPEEFSAGHLANAVNIDFQAPDFEEKIKTLDRSKTYLVYCAAGVRSAKASAILEKQEFKHINNCQKGYEDLKENGIPAE